MALIFGNRVLESSTSTGTGDVTLSGAVSGYQRFSAVCSVADTIHYAIYAVDANGNPSGEWEAGLGTYSASNTLTRTTVEESSNAGAAVSFGAGTKHVLASPTAAFFDGTTIGNLTAASTLDGTEYLIVEQSGDSKRTTTQEIADLASFVPVFNFTSDGEARLYADAAMTLTEQDTSGTGTVAYEKSTAAAPDSFASTTSPITLEAGAWLKVSASSVSTIFAVALKRTA